MSVDSILYPNVPVSNTIDCGEVISLGVQVYKSLSIYWPLIYTSNSFFVAVALVVGLIAANPETSTVVAFEKVAVLSVNVVM